MTKTIGREEILFSNIRRLVNDAGRKRGGMLSSKVIFRKVARAEGHFFIYIDSLWKINEIYISTSGPVWAYYTNHPSTDHSFVKTFSGDIIAIFVILNIYEIEFSNINFLLIYRFNKVIFHFC